MFYYETLPTFHLQRYIEKIWVLETYHEDTYPLKQVLTASTTMGWIFSYREVAQHFVLDGKLTALPNTFLFTQPYGPWTVLTEGPCGIIGVFFKAGALHALFKIPMTQAMGHIIEPQALLGNQPVRGVLEKLAEAQLKDRIAFLEHFLTPYFSQFRHAPIEQAVRLIRQHHGKISIEQLSGQLGISRRMLEKHFAEKVGVSPKHYSRITRFNALQMFWTNYPHTSWLDLTHHFGYADQSHLIKDFHDFTGNSPLHFSVLDRSLSQHFMQSDRQENSF